MRNIFAIFMTLTMLVLFSLFAKAAKELTFSSNSVPDWHAELKTQIAAHLPEFNKASDWTEYCAPFKLLKDEDKISVIYWMSLQICKYESGCDPRQVTPDDVNGTASIGLFQLSYEDNMKWCAMDSKKKNLTDGIVNVQCAVPKMAKLIAEDGVVSQGQAKGTRKGLARYWSVTWPGPKQGHLDQIKSSVRSLAICKAL